MADLEQALDRLLADPEAMAQIMDLAGKLGGPGGSPEAEAPPPEVSVSSADDPGPDPARLAPLLALLRSAGGADPESDALLKALRPYLSESRRQKLDRAIRLSALFRTGKAALGLWKEGKLSV